MAAKKELVFDIFGRDRSASRAMKGVGDAGDHMARRVKAAGVAIAAAVASAAVGIAVGSAESIRAFAEAEQAQNRLQFATQKFPALADTNVRELRKLNEALQAKTRFDDDQIASAQSVLAQYDLTGAQLKQLTPLLLDYAAVVGQDVPSAAEDLGSALLGQGRSLKKVGINFEDAGSVAANYQQLIEGLGRTVSNFAQKDAETLAGKLDQIRNRFGDVQETIGEALAPFADMGLDFLQNSAIPALQQMATDLAKSDLAAQLEMLGPKLGEAFSSLVTTFSSNLPAMIEGMESLASAAPAAVEAMQGFFNFVGNGDLGPAADNFSLGDYFQGLEDSLDQFHGVATEAEEDLAEALRRSSDLIKARWSATVGSMKAELQEANMYMAGHDFVAGFALGIGDASYLAEVQAENMALRTARKAQNAMEIKSPSEVMRRLGQFVSEGFALGIGDNMHRAAEEIARLRELAAADSAFHAAADVDFMMQPARRSGSGTGSGGAGSSPTINININGAVLHEPNALARTVDGALRKAVKDGTLPREWYSRR